MKITYYDDYNQMSEYAKDLMLNIINYNKNSLLCLATGHSPLKSYQLFVEYYIKEPSLFNSCRILKLDEWGGVPINDPQTCESFLQENLLKPLKISPERYFAFISNPSDPVLECARIQTIINNQGPIDLCVLGLGNNGHIGFNEPADALLPHSHVATLSQASMQHSMAKAMQHTPTYGMTLGMSDILQAKKIILLITGKNKQSVVKQLLQQKITTHLPASLLWLHADVECLIDKNVMK